MKKYFFITFIFLIICNVDAVTNKTIAHGNWANPSVWSEGQIPSNEDSIIVSHYVVINADLIINSPSVLKVENTGTICGDYLLNISCGAKWYNYGSVFINRFILRYGANYCTITTRGTSTVTGCPSGSWSVVPPKGNMNIVSWSACNAIDTNWDSFVGIVGGCTVGIKEYTDVSDISFYPNPVNDKLQIECTETKKGNFSIMDLSGRCLKTSEESLFKKTDMDFSDLTEGIYFLKLKTQEYTIIKKIIKN